jgi:hypothetical protein
MPRGPLQKGPVWVKTVWAKMRVSTRLLLAVCGPSAPRLLLSACRAASALLKIRECLRDPAPPRGEVKQPSPPFRVTPALSLRLAIAGTLQAFHRVQRGFSEHVRRAPGALANRRPG